MQVFNTKNNDDIKAYIERYYSDKKDLIDIDKLDFVCNYYETRNSWGHKGYIIDRDNPYGDKKITGRIRYYNRTWERYTYESLLYYMIDKLMKKVRKTKKA